MQPHGLCSPWNSPGQNTRVDSLSFLQGILPTQGSKPGLPHCRWVLYQLSHRILIESSGLGKEMQSLLLFPEEIVRCNKKHVTIKICAFILSLYKFKHIFYLLYFCYFLSVTYNFHLCFFFLFSKVSHNCFCLLIFLILTSCYSAFCHIPSLTCLEASV